MKINPVSCRIHLLVFDAVPEAFRCLHCAVAHQAGTPIPSIGISRVLIRASRRFRL